MSLDEKAFHFALKTWKRFKKKSILETYDPDGFSTREIHRSLLCLTQALADEPILIGWTNHWFGWNNNTIFFPEILRIAKENKKTGAKITRNFLTIQIAKILIAREIFKEIFQKKTNENLQLNNEKERIQFGIEHFHTIHTKCCEIFPGFSEINKEFIFLWKTHHQIHASRLFNETPLNSTILSLWNLNFQKKEITQEKISSDLFCFLVVPVDSNIILPSNNLPDALKNQYNFATGKELKIKTKDKVELIHLPEKKDQTNPITHNLEKLLTADEYKGGQKNIDGEDELKDHQEALEELNLSQVVRSPEVTQGLLKSNLMVNFDATDAQQPELIAQSFFYDEWNSKTFSYKKKWCRISEVNFNPEPIVFEQTSSVSPIPRFKIESLKREFAHLANQRSLKRRVREGHDIDLDSAVDHYISLASKSQPDDRCDLSRPQKEKDLAILILQDLSFSTDSWVNNYRVLDLCRTSIQVLGEVITPFHPLYSIYGFYSHTHRDCRIIKIKEWSENWKTACQRLLSIHPMGYTRIGPALRHCSHLINQTHAKKKLIIIISDGKPNDYDQYEGRYGIQDVHRAVLEAQASGISTQCIAIDQSSKSYLPMMFQQGNFFLLSNPIHLIDVLSSIFKEIF